MKLVVLTNILTPYRIPLFAALRDRVDEFAVLLMAQQEENRQWRLPETRFRAEVLPGLHVRPPGRAVSLHVNYGVVAALRRLAPDVVLSGGFAPANILACAYCALSGKAYVGWGEVTSRDGSETSRLRRAVRRWIGGRSSGAVASSSEARDTFVRYGVPRERVLLSPLPIDVAWFHDRAQAFRKTEAWRQARRQYGGPVLLSVGRLTAVKGYRELFAVYQRLLAARPDATLLIVGDGPDRAEYETSVRERGWKRVHFIGFVQADGLPQWLALADVFVFPTLFDPFGAVLSEAMAAEVPVVSSVHAAATGDLVEQGVTGFRIDPRHADSSAAAILTVLHMAPEQRAVLGRAGYERVRRHDIAPSADLMARFMEDLLTGKMSVARPAQPAVVNGMGKPDAG